MPVGCVVGGVQKACKTISMENTCPYQIHQERIYTLAYKYMANHEDAEDIVQEVLLRLWNHSSRIDKEKVGAWIRRVTRNACLDALHRRKSYRSVVGTQNFELILPKVQAIEKNLPQYLKTALDRLEDPYRTLVLLRDIEELPYKIICRELKMPLNTVKVYLHRGRRCLRDFLE